MAKSPTFDNITAAFASASKLNANFDAIETSFQNTLSLDGSTPNAMNADLDMNSNDILNVKDIYVDDIIVDGVSLMDQVNAAATSASNAATSETNAAASEAAAAQSAIDAAALTTFTALTDVPSTYSGEGGKFLKVKVGEDGLEFGSASGTEPSDGDKGDITVSASGLTWNIDAGVVDTTELATDAVTTVKITDANVTFAKIASAAYTGSDVLLVSGTAGTTDYTAKWNVDGDLVDGFEVLDEDNMVSDSATKLCTQQSIKAYVDTEVSTAGAWELYHAQDQQAAGSDGGSFNSGAWRTRTINQEVTDELTGASLATNQITLPAGTYYVDISVPAHEVARHQAILYNVTDASNELIGTSVAAGATEDTVTVSLIKGKFTIAGAKAFEVRHQCSNSRATDGFGLAANFGVTEIYTDVYIWKKS